LATLVYHFRFPDGRTESLEAGPQPPGEPQDALPPWTDLGFHQCANCPLQTSDSRHCPMAVRLVPLVALFEKVRSYDDVTAQVESDERTVTKRTTVQKVLRSLMGLLSASSDCPRIEFLKPMAHYHLPFSSRDETVFRVVSTYLLAQYFLRHQGKSADAGLEGLKAHYRQLQQVNQGMAARLGAIRAEEGDSSVNALVLLDLFAHSLPDSIDADLEELMPAFQQYLKMNYDRSADHG
jgi:hypothetical protein